MKMEDAGPDGEAEDMTEGERAVLRKKLTATVSESETEKIRFLVLGSPVTGFPAVNV